MTDFIQDWAREARTGVPEAVFCAHKSPEQIEAIVAGAQARQKPLLLTRLTPEAASSLGVETRRLLDFDPLSRTAILGETPPRIDAGIALVAAGTSDLPIAREAVRTLAFCGYRSTSFVDVGVAGLWRLLERMEEVRRHRVVIAFAGMEGALFSVLAGLVAAPVIAVPTSVGYGVSSGGQAALGSALSSCAPGVMTVNIDNGFGAAVAAIKIVHLYAGLAGSPPPVQPGMAREMA
ncbi:MAG: nickel pincer cofactor biosynthesis protein LarB [Mesorhizobium sp.]|uniref:nickel pincer cofactor biosynthesis protein LarB n=1 Tax=Mesorhizobium sp. TaxID=1871066 RepID=UPI000FE5023A|nr:nickel pincer cofactor biosynthesis protein LarB [Mesorhizobium sp.]RWH94073.1 MAG: nickel pincer cofactor biosynthesis protein LarB [Mesorhizobium sp.]RWK82703.1 MAG: nickel pincer cofactor biosynthesis protein LarB [Mesorhizobium sp.]RWL06510.1 MAG: nickel pincer cofactor biosynthesis protein LarB [Mesorhizobium sp.]